MFTGLVEGIGTIRTLIPEGQGLRIGFAPPPELDSANIAIGDSIAINGCCLTVIEFDSDEWVFEAGSETLSKTNLGELAVGSPINVERAIAVGDRLGGHFVQGHVDGTGLVSEIIMEGEWIFMHFAVDPSLARLMVAKGSVAVDGVSLTVVEATSDRFSIALIPHTLKVTTLGTREICDRVNIETDILGKYVDRLLSGKDAKLPIRTD